MDSKISQKNLQFLNELLGAEKLAFAKAQTFSSQATIEELKSLLSSFAKKHEQHYNELFKYLKSHQ